jgi:ribosome silencing factor RsfS/YbeB/iojap
MSGRRPIIARKPIAETGKPTRAAGASMPSASLAEVAKAPGTARKKAVVAGPQGARGRKIVREPLDVAAQDKYLAVITESLADDKGEDIVTLDLTGRASFADRMVIATGIADRQISAMATHLETKLKEVGLKQRVLIEGAGSSDWVLLDAGDIVVHLFKPEARALYGLERMWGADLDEPAEAEAETEQPVSL